jgi:uncharacterized protein YjbI with pentapeptide repeats
MIEIKNRYTNAVLFSHDCDTWKTCVEAAVKAEADLYGANLRGADLRGANLYRADLSGANLSGANLYGADLYRADLSGADLSGANLYWANLRGANLYGADLYRADLSGANLSGANLYWANLRGADLSGEKLKHAPLFVSNLRWEITITDGYLTIGCQRHTHDQWAQFSDDEISQMESNASAFWATWKQPLLLMCAAHASKSGENHDAA